MDIREACNVLEVSEDIIDEELKAKYKVLARKYHPDVYKDDPDKFKTINEAYQFILDYRAHPEKYQSPQQGGFWGSVVDIGDILFNNGGGFFRNTEDLPPIRTNHINITIDLTFHEAVKGCTKEISYKRNIKCAKCQGAGFAQLGNGCTNCDGYGRCTSRDKNMIFQSACNKCSGKGIKKQQCEGCKGKQVIEDIRTGNINIPPGSSNGNTLRLHGQGNFAGKNFFADAHTDVNIRLKVATYKNLSLKDNSVYSNINITLLEALEGVLKEVETINGNKEISIPAKTRHTDQIKIPKCGVPQTPGTHTITINVEYPEDIDKLISHLKPQNADI